MNPSTAQAAVIVDELIRGGVRDVVLSPGSRNAPLSFALFDADKRSRLRLHVRIDERSAGFLAVGLAVASDRPVVVVMTSGTAVANLGPAVLEANYARVPLIVLSANRPYELLGTGANQTIEQFGLFGSQVRATIGLGLAEPEPERQNSAWRSAVCRVLAEACGTRSGLSGPVQFDVPLREPLVPDTEPAAVPEGRADGAPWTRVPDARIEVDVPVDLSVDTVVIAGHGSGRLPELDGVPTIAEPTARQRGIPTSPLALLGLRPRQVVISGRPTLHRPVSALLADPQVNVIALTTGPRWPDVSGNIAATGTRPRVAGAPSGAWLDSCAKADQRALESVAEQLAEHSRPTGLHVAREVVHALRAGDQLVLGASNPVRDVSLVGEIPAGVLVRSNRGVAGIDGVVSTAIGAALGHESGAGTRTVALMGDLTFLHDANGLLLGPDEPRPRDLTIVVANDAGGGIFELLEQGDPRHGAAFERVFGTPHGTDLAALCAAHRVPHSLVPLAALATVLGGGEGLRVVEVATDRSGLRALHEAIRAGLW